MKVQRYLSDGTLVHEYDIEEQPSPPLDGQGAFATLTVVLGIVPLQDAANALGLPPETLVAEAEAWAAAQWHETARQES